MESGNSISVALWAIGALQSVTFFLVVWLKKDIKELWNRADKHGHVIECDGENCKPKTAAVILPEK